MNSINFLFYHTTQAKNFQILRISISFQLAAAEKVAQQCARTRARVFKRPGWTRTGHACICVPRRARFSDLFFSPLSLFFFSSIPARSVCRSSALIASKNVGRARVPLPRIPSSPFRNVPMIFRPPNSHLSLTGHATNKISSASPWPPA